MSDLEISNIRTTNWCKHIGNYLVVSTRPKHRPTPSPLPIFPKRNEYNRPSKHMNIIFQSKFIYNCQKLETTQLSTEKWVHKLWYSKIMDYYIAMKK